MSYLQSYVVPICTFRLSGDNAVVERLWGTGFFLAGTNKFITARHVVERAQSASSSEGSFWGLLGKSDNGRSPLNVCIQPSAFEFPPDGLDVCLGEADYWPPSPLCLDFSRRAIWHECATFGYPENASYGQESRELWMDIRAMRGYIQRLKTKAPSSSILDFYELSFQINSAMSGSPIFTYSGNFDFVFAIASGTSKSEIVEEVIEDEISDDGIVKVRKVYREHFGRALPVERLADWQPQFLGGQSLAAWSAAQPKPPASRSTAPGTAV